MTDKPIKVPGPEHPITTERNGTHVVVKVGDRIIADTQDSVTLKEARHDPVHYIPRRDVDMTQLQRTDHTSYCAYKGEASYYSIPIGGDRSVNAVWTYEAPFEWLADIEGHLAFYTDRVDSITDE